MTSRFMLSLFIAVEVLNITVMWYYAVGAFVLGVFVAYAFVLL